MYYRDFIFPEDNIEFQRREFHTVEETFVFFSVANKKEGRGF